MAAAHPGSCNEARIKKTLQWPRKQKESCSGPEARQEIAPTVRSVTEIPKPIVGGPADRHIESHAALHLLPSPPLLFRNTPHPIPCSGSLPSMGRVREG
jgi:hypothetical protein